MTDERLDHILKQALTPEVSEKELCIEKKGRIEMKKAIKRFTAVAAALALLVAGVFTVDYIKGNEENSFTIKVSAAELNEDEPTYIGEYTSNSYGIGYWEDGKCGFCLGTDFICEGEGIKNITYSIKNAAFNIIGMEDESLDGNFIVTDSIPYEGNIKEVGFDGKDEDYEGGVPANNYVSSYTVKYDNQSSTATAIVIHGNNELDEEAYNEYLNDQCANRPELTAEILDKLLKDVVITCTVEFEDGSTSSRDVVIGATIMKHSDFMKVKNNCATEYDEEPCDTEFDDKEFCYLTYELKK